MPLLWKKSIAQLSCLVSDLRSRRSRSSLLVQTGFPTSLADLVVKHRTRLKKSSSSLSKKRRKKIARGDCSPTTDPPSPPPPPPPRSVISSFSEAPVLELTLKDESRSEIGEEFCRSELSCSGSEEFKDVVGVSDSRFFSVIIKLFFVVVLALGTKEIAVGITASTFLLFFLEFVGKRLSFSSRDYAGGLGLNRVNVIRANESDFGSSGCDSVSVEVEKTWNPEICANDEIQAIESELDLFKDKRRLECPEKELKSEVLAGGDDGDLIKVEKCRNRKLGRAIFKDKFLKKFIPKKFRGSKNGKVSEGKLDSSSESSEFKGGVEEEEEEEEGEEEEDAQEAEGEEICSSVSSNNTSLVNLEDMGLMRKNARKEMAWNRGHLVSIVIVLFGLVGGRVIALLLTIAWFLLVKSVEASWGNFKKMYESGILLIIWISDYDVGSSTFVLAIGLAVQAMAFLYTFWHGIEAVALFLGLAFKECDR